MNLLKVNVSMKIKRVSTLVGCQSVVAILLLQSNMALAVQPPAPATAGQQSSAPPAAPAPAAQNAETPPVSLAQEMQKAQQLPVAPPKPF